MQNENYFDDFIKKLYIIGIGNDNNNQLFHKVLGENFSINEILEHVMILKTHNYKLSSINDRLIELDVVKKDILKFVQSENKSKR